MCSNELKDKITERFNKVKNRFRFLCLKKGIDFNEDVFSDTVLKTYEKLDEKGIDNIDDATSYLWSAFKLNTFRNMKYYHNRKHKKEMLENDDIIDCEELYDSDLDSMYELIINDIIERYGNEWITLFRLHIEKGYMYKDLSELSREAEDTIHKIFKDIKNYIRNKYNANLS